MNRPQTKLKDKLTPLLLTFCAVILVGILPALAEAQAGPTGSAAGTPAATKPAASPSTNAPAPAAADVGSTTKPSTAEIAAAKASSKVWVNTGTGVYHKGGRWYGKTKAGKFMTEAEAKAAGYKAAKE